MTIPNLNTDNISTLPCYTDAGAEFNGLGWQMFVMKEGSVVDVLFQNDEFVIKHSHKVRELEKFYDKKFIPGTINGEACMLHQCSINNQI